MNQPAETRSLAHVAAPRRASAVRFGRSRRDQADGFTLIELLVSITIIAIIAAFSAGVVFTAQDQARASATEALISKLHAQMAMRWEEYGTRRVGVAPLQGANANNVQALNIQRVYALQELMRFELPDQYGDIFDPTNANNPPVRLALQATPALTFAYQRRVSRQVAQPQGIDMKTAFAQISTTHASAECLYLIMTTGMIDATSSGDYFSDSDSGDTDGDGMREFIDGWGHPIEWIRWPTAFVSDMQPGTVFFEDPATGMRLVDRDVAANRDPFNPALVDEQYFVKKKGRGNKGTPAQPDLDVAAIRAGQHEWGYRLTPLIVSPGRDGVDGINFGRKPSNTDVNDPYAVFSDGHQRGEVLRDEYGNANYEDNIHNHLVGTR